MIEVRGGLGFSFYKHSGLVLIPIHYKVNFVPFIIFLPVFEIIDMIVNFEMSKETESEENGDFGSIDLSFVIPLVAHGLFVPLTEQSEIARL